VDISHTQFLVCTTTCSVAIVSCFFYSTSVCAIYGEIFSEMTFGAGLQNRLAPDSVHCGSIMVQYHYQDWFDLEDFVKVAGSLMYHKNDEPKSRYLNKYIFK